MSATKKKILNTSRELFNRLSFGQVTIRMIAQELQMSSGNLNYHFRKREDILQALYFEMVEEFDKRVNALPETSFSFEQIRKDMKTSMERMFDYHFFWTDLYNLLQLDDQIKQHFQTVFEKRFQGCLFLFQELIRQEMMHPPTFEQEYNLLAERMIDYGNTWLYSSQLYSQKKVKVDESTDKLICMLYPYLTSKGKEAFQMASPHLFK